MAKKWPPRKIIIKNDHNIRPRILQNEKLNLASQLLLINFSQ